MESQKVSQRSSKTRFAVYEGEHWNQTVYEFSAKALTFNADKLPALSALAKETQKKTGWAYVAGLWKEDLHAGILWEASVPGVRRRAPSWSWASIDFSAQQLSSGTANIGCLPMEDRRGI